MTDLIIIGAGPAGLSAAIYAQRAGLGCIVLDKAAYGGQLAFTNDIENYPSVAKTGGVELAINFYNQATSLGADIRFEEVTALDLAGDVKHVTTSANVYKAHTVILATGAARRRLGAPGEERLIGRGVSYCPTCDGAFYKEKTVAVVGGGNTALEDALFLSTYCRQVYLVHRQEDFKAEEVLQTALAAKQNIEAVRSATVRSVEGDDRVSHLLLDTPNGGRRIDVDGVFIAAGQDPQTSLFPQEIPLTPNGYCAVGEDTITPLPGVFAAGDIRDKPLRQIVTAAADGAVAAVAASTFCSFKHCK